MSFTSTMEFLLEHIGPVLLMVAAVGWYVSVLVATVAMGGARATASGRARAAWYCTIPVVLMGLAGGRYETATIRLFLARIQLPPDHRRLRCSPRHNGPPAVIVRLLGQRRAAAGPHTRGH